MRLTPVRMMGDRAVTRHFAERRWRLHILHGPGRGLRGAVPPPLFTSPLHHQQLLPPVLLGLLDLRVADGANEARFCVGAHRDAYRRVVPAISVTDVDDAE